MKRLGIIVSLGLSLVAVSGGVSAQDPNGAVINADGNSGASNAGLNPAVDADGPTIVYGDLDVGPGTTVIGPPVNSSVPGAIGNITATDGDASVLGNGDASAAPGTVTRGSPGTELLGPDGTYSVTEEPPSSVSVGEAGALAPAPEPVVETVPEETAAAPVDAAVATGGDVDADNIADELEWDLGLDPNNVDTDGDGVADGDEINIYGTEPTVWDTDGDGIADGTELYDTRTDPLVWDTDGAAVSDGGGETASSTETVATEETAVAGDSDSDRLADADEAALGTDAMTPDSDGDGYYDGDEANLGTDPLDSTSFPAV